MRDIKAKYMTIRSPCQEVWVVNGGFGANLILGDSRCVCVMFCFRAGLVGSIAVLKIT